MVESSVGFVFSCLLQCFCDSGGGSVLLTLAIGLSVPAEGVWLWVELWEEL